MIADVYELKKGGQLRAPFISNKIQFFGLVNDGNLKRKKLMAEKKKDVPKKGVKK